MTAMNELNHNPINTLKVVHEIADYMVDPEIRMGLVAKTEGSVIKLYWVPPYNRPQQTYPQQIPVGVVHVNPEGDARSVYTYRLTLVSWMLSVRDKLQRKLDTSLTAWAFADRIRKGEYQQVPLAIY